MKDGRPRARPDVNSERHRNRTPTVKFYDLLSIHPKIWSYKTRFVLNHKHIPYNITGVHYPDIEETSKSLGLGPAERPTDLDLPIIEFEGTVVRGSLDIAKFLDSKFPERPIVGDDCEKRREYCEKDVDRRSPGDDGPHGACNSRSEGPGVFFDGREPFPSERTTMLRWWERCGP